MGLESVVDILKKCKNIDFDPEEIVNDVIMLVDIAEGVKRLVFWTGRIVDLVVHGDYCFVYVGGLRE